MLVEGTIAHALGPSDLLVETSAGAFANAHPGLRFLADAWFLLAGGQVDWERVAAHAGTARRALPTSLVVGRLAATTGSAVPRRELAALERARLREAAVGLAGGAVRGARRIRVRTARP